ncbi:MAG TPA: GspH/FimT family pseudopilin [Patescibacteria group bacterium]|nr:GspH/FimT family pseudopilin [Patescibacteria group bacterium]
MVNVKNHIRLNWIQQSNISLSRGFTLLEMLVVFTIMGILTATGMASFFSYSQNQAYNSAVSNVEAMLQLARSRALSQVKPVDCGTEAVRSYQVAFIPSGATYELRVTCGTATQHVLQTSVLPDTVLFDATTTPVISFGAGTAAATPAPGTVVITGYDKTKTITVNSAGIIAVQ